MKIYFQEQSIEFEQAPSVEDIIESMNVLLKNDFYYSHLIIDKDEIIEDLEVLLQKNILGITSIEIIAETANDFINNLLLSSEEYINRAVPHITKLTDNFYNNPSATNWRELADLFEGIEWLLSMSETIDQSILRPANWKSVVTNASTLQQELEQLEEALKNIDTVLIADILKYELLPAFESFSINITTAIDVEGTRHDLS